MICTTLATSPAHSFPWQPPPHTPSLLQTSPDSVYQVMMNCWEKESVRRPTFAQCKDDLEDLMRNSFVGRYVCTYTAIV